ncbi:MAG: hypothetical protein HY360_16435 [Verrucomicrobia bacterium]|nr:hypothetical protein [Verrucomicrobiota bacterium]
MAADRVVPVEEQAPDVETRPASALGTTAITVNGRIQPHGQPTTYWFEHGTSTEYGQTTAERPLPPRLAAYYHESWDQKSWDEGLTGWRGGMSSKDLTHLAEGGKSGGFVRFSEPTADDTNHADGIGTVNLAQYFYPGTYPSGSGAYAYLAAGHPDLRDARMSLWVRGNHWVPNGSELVFWAQSDHDVARQLTADWRRANWAYTGFSLNDHLQSGKWEFVEYRLLNDSHAWTYAGNANQRTSYAYAPLDNVLGQLNCNFFHILAFVELTTGAVKNQPRGSIDFDEFTLAYRNDSLVFPGNGGKLVSAPSDALDNARTLADGWRHGPGKMWRSAARPSGPQEFVYGFEKTVTIKAVQIHQHSQWPSKEIEVLVSPDGQLWKTVFGKTLPERSPAGPNFTFLLERLSEKATQMKVRILSGYKAEHWGLGEIEVFGSDAVMSTDDDWYHVNMDIKDLKPGQTYVYRLVAKSSTGTTRGRHQTFTVPVTATPLVITGEASRIGARSAKIEGRLNALGTRTQFYFEYGSEGNYAEKTPLQYGGLQITPRTVLANLTGLKPGAVCHYRLVGTNETGTSYGEDKTLKTRAE